MNVFIKLFFLPLATSLLIAFFTTPVVIALAKRLKIIDDPKKHKHPKVIHTYPVPRGGGAANFIAILISSLFFLPLDKHLAGILLGASLVVFLGLLDDRFNINPYLRLLVQFLTATIPILAGIGISFLSNPFNGIIDLSSPKISFFLLGKERSIWILSDLFAFFWIVFMMNMLNMGAKGVDGQLPGVVSIASLTIAFLALHFSTDITQWPISVLAAITAGSYIGFLPWNFFPQKIMPGFSGSTLAGYLLAILSILSTTKVGTLTVVLGVPLIDTGYTILRRLLQGKSPVWGDRGHLHHKLLDAGLSKRQVAFFYWTVTGILGFLALNLNTQQKLYTILGLTLLIGGLLLLLTYKVKS